MKTREIGTLEVLEMGAGCMSISANYGPPADINQGFGVIRFARLTHCNSVAPCLAMALATACKCNPPSGKPPQRALQRSVPKLQRSVPNSRLWWPIARL
jgi:hypothetical protein